LLLHLSSVFLPSLDLLHFLSLSFLPVHTVLSPDRCCCRSTTDCFCTCLPFFFLPSTSYTFSLFLSFLCIPSCLQIVAAAAEAPPIASALVFRFSSFPLPLALSLSFFPSCAYRPVSRSLLLQKHHQLLLHLSSVLLPSLYLLHFLSPPRYI
jgi:hypothetical protein